MTDAPERIWMDPDIKFPECEKKYGCDVEYVRADLAAPKVKPLVWEYHPAGKLASNNMGNAYIIDNRGPRPKWLKWPGGHGPERETMGEMEAAAQADYERRILEALE